MRGRAALLACGLACAGCVTSESDRPNASATVTHTPATPTMSHPASQAVAALHEAASNADGDRYFALFTRDAVFLGTDPDERWTLAEFRAFAEPYFSQGRGWTYHQVAHQLRVSDGGRTAWFDEELFNQSYGRCRGSGVVVRGGDGVWRIAQYNLSIPMPNDLTGDFVARIRAWRVEHALPADPELPVR